MVMEMKVGDLKPNLVIECFDGTTRPDLTTAESVQVVAQLNGAFAWKRSATGDAEGNVTYVWQAGDTDTAGQLAVEALVTWPGTKPQRFRPPEAVKIVPNLG